MSSRRGRHRSRRSDPDSDMSGFTCMTCRVAFVDADLQRAHYKTDWHRYNLKRKVADMPPVTADNFQQRVLSQKAQVEEEEKDNSGHCTVCNKHFNTRNAYDNHIQSKKHKEAVAKQTPAQAENSQEKEKNAKNQVSKEQPSAPSSKPRPSRSVSEDGPSGSGSSQATDNKMEVEGEDDDDAASDAESCESWAGEALSPEECLFCSHSSSSLEKNVRHMTLHHSFFLPDLEYVSDLEGLVTYLGEKVGEGHICLWCNERSKAFWSTRAVQQHMVDKGHCKMLHDGDTLFEYADFYDYRSSYPDYDPSKVNSEGEEKMEDGEDEDEDEVEKQDMDGDGFQLVLPSGAVIGHRSLQRYFRQKLRPDRQVALRKPSALNRVMAQYKALGWTGATGPLAQKKAKDVAYIHRIKSRRFMNLGVKANKLQPHFRAQIMGCNDYIRILSVFTETIYQCCHLPDRGKKEGGTHQLCDKCVNARNFYKCRVMAAKPPVTNPASSPSRAQTVRVLYDYEYTASDGRLISLTKGSTYTLVKKANDEWWAVTQPSSDKNYFFVPANYVEITDIKKKKKPPPPKPPKPKLPQPALDPSSVIKELDAMLDTMVMVDDEDEDKDSNDNLKAELRAKTPERELEDSHHLAAPTNGGSLDRRTTNVLGHTRSNSASALHSDRPKVQPRLTNINYNEQPMYANLQELEGTSPTPATAAEAIKTDPDDGEEPNYANLATLQGALTYPALPPPGHPPPGAQPLRVLDTHWCMYKDASTDHNYYYNATSGESTWHLPPTSTTAGPEEVKEDDEGGPQSYPPGLCHISSHPKAALPSILPGSRGASPVPPGPRGPPRGIHAAPGPPNGSLAGRMNSFGTSTTLESFRVEDNKALTRPQPKGSLPAGWREEKTEGGETAYKNEFTSERWFQSAANESGQVYYYKEGTSESSWQLPDINSKPALDKGFQSLHHPLNLPKSRASWSPGEYSQLRRVAIPHPHKMSPSVREEDEEMKLTHGDVFEPVSENEPPLPSVRLSQIPQHSRIREMQTTLNRSKVMENGKKIKKNWALSYVVTTGPFMYFYKDQKSAQPKANMPVGKYEVQLDLRGASAEPAPKEYSSKKNVILLSLSGGATQFLLQSDDKARLNDWFSTLLNNISLLVHPESEAPSNLGNHFERPPDSPTLTKGAKSRRNTRREKTSTLERPTTPDDTLSGAEKTIKVKDWLLYWLLRRPTAEALKEKGIIKDSIFGSHLQSICDREKVMVPRFVHHCIHSVDKRGLTVGGIYRISGNMASIQKLRFLVDHGEKFDLLSPDWDIHDISGALKLFFRELQEPLYPFNLYDKFTRASQILSRPLKLKAFQDIIKELPKINYATLRDLLAHLRRVMDNSKENKMEAQNIAIVFGPTLMRPQDESGNMAANVVMQGQIVEYMILEYRSLF